MIAVTAGCALLFSIFYMEARKVAIEGLHEEQAIHARQASHGIEAYFATWSGILRSFSQMDGIIRLDDHGKKHLEFLYKSHMEQVRTLTRVDENGVILYTVPDGSSIGKDISSQKHIQEILKNHKPVVSDVFRAVQGFDTVVLHVPVVQNGVFKGTLAVGINFENLAKRYLDVIKIRYTGYAWVISRDGTQLYSPIPGFTGRPASENYRNSSSALLMIENMLKGREGTAVYTFDKTAESTADKKYAVYMPIRLNNTFWSIAVVAGEKEALSGLVSFRNKLVFVVGAIFICGIIIAAFGAKAWVIVRESEKRKIIENDLRKSEAEFRRLYQEFNALLDAIPDNITLLDREHRILWANAAAVKSFVAKSMDIVGRYCFSLRHNRTSPCDKCPVSMSIRTSRPAHAQGSTPDGRLWELRTAPLLDEHGEVVSIIEVARDVTEHKKLEEQLRHAQKLEGIGQLAGGIAHDFNNLLNAVLGYASLLQMSIKESDSLRHYVDQIYSAGIKGAALTKQILALSRKQVLDMNVVDINDVIRGLEPILRRLVREDITIKYDLHKSVLMIMADPGQITQVLMNLATNASDAMPSGGTLLISTEQFEMDRAFAELHGYDKPGRYALLAVSDTGCGMTEEVKAKIFDPFFTTKEVGKGTGLGLAVVHGIVKQHGGYINVYSELDKGTVFKIYMPVTSQAPAEKAESVDHQVSGGTETILVAEDDASLRALTETILKQYGYSVITASDGQDAVEKFSANMNGVSLVVLDGIMPRKNGKQVFEEMQKMRSDIKAIFMSGYAEDIFTHDGMPDKAAAFIQKPVKPEQLLRTVRRILDS